MSRLDREMARPRLLEFWQGERGSLEWVLDQLEKCVVGETRLPWMKLNEAEARLAKVAAWLDKPDPRGGPGSFETGEAAGYTDAKDEIRSILDADA